MNEDRPGEDAPDLLVFFQVILAVAIGAALSLAAVRLFG